LARRVVEDGWTLRAAAEAAGVSVRCATKWVGRYRAGDRQLHDRSSAPRTVANRTPVERVAVIVKLRRLRMTAAEIAETLAIRTRRSRRSCGEKGSVGLAESVSSRKRYERSRPGELVHIDVKKLGRFQAAGKRVGFRLTQTGRPRRRDADGHDRGVSVAHAVACRTLGIRHLRTRPRRPQTNGKPSASSAPS
jgi:hypothetical protein